MENQIILQGTTTEALANLISDAVKIQIDELKKSLAIHEPDELMSREQTLAFLQIDSSTLWAWTNKGKIIAYGIANRRYYKKAELLECLTPLKK